MSIARKLACSATLVALLAASTFLLAGPKDADKDSGDVKFTSHSQMVLIPVIVADRSGRHVDGLKQSDFTVWENGVAQKVATFEEVTSDTQRFSRPANPGEYTNMLGGAPVARRITVILLDFINTPFIQQAKGRRELLNYLAESVDQREPTALYTLTTTGIHVVHDFTSDPEVLAAALQKVRGKTVHVVTEPKSLESRDGMAEGDKDAGLDQSAVSAEVQSIRTLMEGAQLSLQGMEQRYAIIYTLQGMQQLAQSLAGVPGRKSVIWAGGGFPFSVSDGPGQSSFFGRYSLSDVLPMYEHTWQLLNDAEIALYPLDVKGLTLPTLPPPSVGFTRDTFASMASSGSTGVETTFRNFAEMTGGRPYYNSNDLAKGFREAVQDSSEYYMLGYYVSRANTKPGWRKLTVKVDREGEVRSRNGFLVSNNTVDPAATRNSDLSTALQSPLDFTALGMVARWDNTEAGSGPNKKQAHYSVNLAPDASLIDGSDGNHVSVEFVTMVKTAEGKTLNVSPGKVIDVHLSPEKAAFIRQTGVAVSGALQLAPGEYSVRFLVRDNLSGRMGSVDAPLKVE